ncbi:MAG: DUF4974 domain-containing protein [Tannerella sp.]|jgi:ferric-dicitrate binding protein FerR (iron transport regulator)|nr:DUF4974 domain-containing protein [Tannerella sp.]
MEENTDTGRRIIHYLLSEEMEPTDRALIEWLDESESNRKIFCRYKRIWNESKYYIETSVFDPETAWEKVNGINRKKNRIDGRLRNMYYMVSCVAASVLVALALSLTGIFEKRSEVRLHMSADYGNRSEIGLPDGSVVKLNSGSDITYSFDKKKNIREVSFQGEGFFNIAKSNAPFVVKIKGGPEVKVLGTSFNLQAYPEDQIVQTSLVEGRVELTYENGKMMLKTGDMVTFDKETNKLERVEGILSHTYGWLENKLYMYDMSLPDVCKHLERWYNVKIAVQAELGESIHYNGVIQEETIVDVMEALSRLSKINYEVKGKNICITSK